LDEETETKSTDETKDKDAGKEIKPGSWVILEKSSSNEPRKLDGRISTASNVLGYDK